MIRVRPEDEGKFVCMVTEQGVIKRTELSAYRNVRKMGLIAVSLDEGDRLAWVRLTSGEDQLIVATRQGMAIRFNETDARVLGRTARGVRALNLEEDDIVVGMVPVMENTTVLTVSENGLDAAQTRQNTVCRAVEARASRTMIPRRMGR